MPIDWDAPEDPVECAAVLVAADSLLGHEERDDAGMTRLGTPCDQNLRLRVSVRTIIQ